MERDELHASVDSARTAARAKDLAATVGALEGWRNDGGRRRSRRRNRTELLNGRHRLERIIGTGGMAIVMLLVIAFVLSPDGGDDGGARQTTTDASAGAAAAPPITLEGRLDQLDRIIRGESP